MRMLQEVSVACVVLCLMISSTLQTKEVRQPRDVTPNKRHRRTVDNNPFQDLVNALQTDGITDTELYMHYTPSTPAPQNINCFVEVPTTIRRGGQCVQLGVQGSGAARTRPWACQAGIHLAFNSHCQNLRSRPGRGRRG